MLRKMSALPCWFGSSLSLITLHELAALDSRNQQNGDILMDMRRFMLTSG
jgi:hypothetical protein